MTLHDEGFRQGVDHALRERARVLDPGNRGLDDRELVASEPGDDVATAQAAAETVGDLPQQCVADGVAESVVDLLESVQVYAQYGQQVAGPSQFVQGRVHVVGEISAIGQCRQRIVEGKPLSFFPGFSEGLCGSVRDPDGDSRHDDQEETSDGRVDHDHLLDTGGHHSRVLANVVESRLQVVSEIVHGCLHGGEGLPELLVVPGSRYRIGERQFDGLSPSRDERLRQPGDLAVSSAQVGGGGSLQVLADRGVHHLGVVTDVTTDRIRALLVVAGRALHRPQDIGPNVVHEVVGVVVVDQDFF